MPDEFPKSRTGIEGLILQHAALVAAFALVALCAVRVYFTAGFDLQTALAILGAVDRTQLLTATLLSAFSLAAPVVAVSPQARRWLTAGNAPGASFQKQLGTALGVMIVFPAVLYTFTLPFLIGWAVALFLPLIVRTVRRLKSKLKLRSRSPIHSSGKPRGDRTRAETMDWLTWTTASLIGLTLFMILQQPWLPRESVKVEGEEPTAVRVVGTQGDMTLLLVDGVGGGVSWVKTNSIEGRELCAIRRDWTSHTLTSLILDRSGTDCKGQ